ncbi:MAG: AtpZ/AtpI family protein [Aquificaceae bacterium]|nr:AtpZ/AtpI family protein [Aquificaceae bacterium]MCS7196424.1 AtpZ/AtpI family protein [Aquificaceae bacterium]MCX7989970.1 AtpZ/AtpI family protein [Aquificaceae bacterium]MDW8032556.1 AtpZ/AtpI family protein [Aquificaceae bacterium]MDW8294223.1 AtpZ/AtpI family protein [Aquificaceae bacterium]
MKGKDFLALTLGFNLVGGVIAGLLVGYAFDRWLMEGLFGIRSFPFGLLFFFFVGILSGFLNVYRDLKRIQ